MDSNCCAWCSSIATRRFTLPRPLHMRKGTTYANGFPWVCDSHHLLLTLKYHVDPKEQP